MCIRKSYFGLFFIIKVSYDERCNAKTMPCFDLSNWPCFWLIKNSVNEITNRSIFVLHALSKKQQEPVENPHKIVISRVLQFTVKQFPTLPWNGHNTNKQTAVLQLQPSRIHLERFVANLAAVCWPLFPHCFGTIKCNRPIKIIAPVAYKVRE